MLQYVIACYVTTKANYSYIGFRALSNIYLAINWALIIIIIINIKGITLTIIFFVVVVGMANYLTIRGSIYMQSFLYVTT